MRLVSSLTQLPRRLAGALVGFTLRGRGNTESMLTILLIVLILVLLFGGGGYYWRGRRY